MRSEALHHYQATFVDYIGFAQEYAHFHPGTLPEITTQEANALYSKGEEILFVFGEECPSSRLQPQIDGFASPAPFKKTPEVIVPTSGGPFLISLEIQTVSDEDGLSDDHILLSAGVVMKRTASSIQFSSPQLVYRITKDGILNIYDEPVDSWQATETDIILGKLEAELALSDTLQG